MPKKVKKEEEKLEHISDQEIAEHQTDVCKTPAPPSGEVPIPYPNIAGSSDTSSGTKSVKVEGKEASLKDKSLYEKSSGDEPSTGKPSEPLGTLNKMIKLFRDHPVVLVVSLAVLCFVVWFLLSNIPFTLQPVEEPLEEPLESHLISKITALSAR